MLKDRKPYTCKGLFTIKLALVIILCYTVVRTVILPKQLEKNLSPASAVADFGIHPSITTGTAADYPENITGNLSGTSGQPAGEGTLTNDSNDLERSVSDELGLVLLGTISGNPALSRALIKNVRTDVFGLYKTGQIVAGACIETIEKKRVILTYNGEKKVLELTTMQSASLDGNTHALSSQTTNEIQNALITDSSTEKTESAAMTRIECINTILQKAIIEPYVTDGQVQGLQLNCLEDTGIAKDFGLKNGDVICAIGGQQLTSKQKALQILKKARSQPSVDIEMLRDNETKKLFLPIK